MKKSTVILMWGGITGVAYAIFFWMLNLADNPSQGIQYLGVLLFFGGLLTGTIQYRNKANGGYLTFGQGYVCCLLISVAVSILSALSLTVFLKVHPEFPNTLIERAHARLINSGLSQDKIDKFMEYAKEGTTPTALVIYNFFGGIITGAIIGLLAAGISIKKRPLFQEDDTNPTTPIQ